MALIYNQVSIFAHDIVYHALFGQTLNNGDINLTNGLALPSTYLSDFFDWEIKKFRYSGNPLVPRVVFDEPERACLLLVRLSDSRQATMVFPKAVVAANIPVRAAACFAQLGVVLA